MLVSKEMLVGMLSVEAVVLVVLESMAVMDCRSPFCGDGTRRKQGGR